MLTEVEEAALSRRARAGDDAARERLVLSHLRLVVRLAFQYAGLGLPLCDLISEGNIGLMRAAVLFDPAFATRFATYAAVWIKKRIRQALTSQSRLVRLPARVVECAAQLKTAETRLEAKLGRQPTEAELADDTDLLRDVLHQLRSAAGQRYVSFHESFPPGDDGPVLAETLADESVEPPDAALARRGDREYAETLLATLKPRDARVLRLRYGLEDGDQRSLEEVGRSVGLVRQRVQQIEAASLTLLRSRARHAERRTMLD